MPAFAQKGPQKPLRQTRRNASSVPTSSVGSNRTTVRKAREGFESTLQHLKRGRAGNSRNETYATGVVLEPGIVQALLHICRLIGNFTG